MLTIKLTGELFRLTRVLFRLTRELFRLTRVLFRLTRELFKLTRELFRLTRGGGGGGGAVLHVSSTLALQYLSIILSLAKCLPMRVVLVISGSLNIK